MTGIGRNDLCPCGSGRKFKQCCLHRQTLRPMAAPTPRPTIPEMLRAGLQCHQSGRLEQARAIYQEILALAPRHADALHLLGVADLQEGRIEQAMARFEAALAINPNDPFCLSNLGNALHALGRFTDAVAVCRRAVELKPDHAEAHNNLANALQDQGRLDEAAASYRTAIALRPAYPEAHNNLGSTLKTLGRLDEGLQHFEQAIRYRPDFAAAHSSRLFVNAWHGLLAPSAYLALARTWEQACLSEDDRRAARARRFERAPLAGRRLKVGYVSGDYFKHAVSYFVEQIFQHHDRECVELFAYSNSVYRDATTERLEALVEHWRPVSGLSDAALRERIAADGIDVLIDLSGHTGSNRLGVFAHRAAPVQATYLGYPASTGLSGMDYWIGDDIVTPASAADAFSEALWRLPRVWISYGAVADAPAPEWLPAADGGLRLGSFNNLTKLTPATLALWSKVLAAVPQSRLLLKTRELGDAVNRQRIIDEMAAHGIAAERLELVDSRTTADWAAHMAYYKHVDIALDPVGGMGGATTTCDALWMGVPVVGLLGDRMASRITASMLDSIGHREWIAGCEAEYVDHVVTLARDPEQRQALRAGLRGEMAASPLCDAAGLARCLEDAYATMFERWRAQRGG